VSSPPERGTVLVSEFETLSLACADAVEHPALLGRRAALFEIVSTAIEETRTPVSHVDNFSWSRQEHA
jgi:hypothetical protein